MEKPNSIFTVEDKMFTVDVEAAGYYETFVTIFQTTRHHTPEGSNLKIHLLTTSNLTRVTFHSADLDGNMNIMYAGIRIGDHLY
jgi:hypothetical protein